MGAAKIIGSPDWTRDLIIYEIATRGFTSPSGPESGTFRSLQEKLPYLQGLGITGIWLTGHSLGDPHHFYNIWTQYANIEPDRFDPALGTPDEFRALVQTAHRHGIRVFLDVHVHGVVSHSPLPRREPSWFRRDTQLAERWGMADYDWQGEHADLDEWWVKIWTDMVLEFGVDGYRLDVGVFRPDLWSRVRENAAAAGHPIVVFSEGGQAIPGVTDFVQGACRVADQRKDGVLSETPLLRDLPSLCAEEKMRERLANGFVTAQLSCHDSGWEGFPEAGNPFVAEGSRCVFGYSVLFTPMIPVFMSGEEFDASYTPIPWLSPKLFGGSEPGKGRWLYGAMLRWEEVEQSPHREMLEDVRKMIEIRRRHPEILGPAFPGEGAPNVRAVQCDRPPELPVPYLRWSGQEAIVIVGNPHADREVSLELQLTGEPFGRNASYLVTDLWSGAARKLSPSQLARFPCTVRRDRSPRGGLGLYKVEPHR